MMSERFPTRREKIESSPDKPEAIASIETLQEIGILTPMKDLDLFHGRSGHMERWVVRDVDNANNNTGNRNINKIPALHTSNQQTAQEFAMKRTVRANLEGDYSRAEVHKIISEDPDASIINRGFNWNSISKDNYGRAIQAFRDTLPSPLEGSPLKFEDRHKLDGLKVSDFTRTGYISKEQVKRYASEYHLTDELTNQVCGAINARMLLSNNPEVMAKVVEAFTNDTGEARFGNVTLPINREYVASWLKKIHVVGEKGWAHSATLGKDIVTYMLFDHERVNTEAEINREKMIRNQHFGKLALAAYQDNRAEQRKYPSNEMQDILKNDYAKPRQIVEAAKRVPGFKNVFEADAGNWEGFSLEEHTETVLENFEYNYADKMPADLLPIMKLGLLVHDIGKPLAVKHNEKNQQEKYNVFVAEKFMQVIGTNEKEREFVLRLIGPGKTLVEDYLFKNPREEAFNRVIQFSANTFQKYTGKNASRADAFGVLSMLMAMQTCDSAAYTDMALTRSTSDNNVTYRNAKSFNKSFDAHGMVHRGVSIKPRL